MAEAEKDERCPIRARVVLAIWSVAAEIDETCLVGMERELVPSETLAQYIQNPLGILEVRERHHGVVSITDKGVITHPSPPESVGRKLAAACQGIADRGARAPAVEATG
jgi:hypothetical protein